MDGLQLLGAASEALADQLITLRVKSIDAEKLKQKLSGTAASVAPAALKFVDISPKAALDIALPLGIGMMKNYGIDAEIAVSKGTTLPKRRAISEFFPGLIIGGIIGGTGFGLVSLVAKLFKR